MSECNPIIDLHGVNVSFDGREALRDVHLHVHAGEFLGIVGPNGGGKTTILKVMLGLIKPNSGTAQLFGQPIGELRARHRIGYVPQKAAQFDPKFPATVSEVASMGRFPRLGLFRRMRREDHTRVAEALDTVGMLERRHELIGRLSGGQQQRVFIARALAGDPEILILDEPTTGVDAQAEDKFYALLKRLNRDMNLTLVLVSHDIGMVSNYVTQLACVNRTIHYHGGAEHFTDADMTRAYGDNMHVVTHQH